MSDIDLIEEFIYSHLNGLKVGHDEDIFESGYVSSLFAVQVLTWVEKTFDLDIVSEDLRLENFRSISAIVTFVESKRSVTADAGA
ncbi:phosphopantetheine-binding protein [Micromonospora sp. NPDC049275]|uniref:phosphopantetheine-binding protein n=1 Tax=Micromonospora sp. NPDC049275 TaxID=3364268 RepID=UPI00371CC713